MKLKLSTKFILFAIFLLAAGLRFYHLNWDQGYHLHPDERAIIMATVGLQFPTSIEQFFSPTSAWNPHFFAYGSLPFYLLKIGGDIMSNVHPGFAQYDLINIVGRYISAIADLVTLILLFKLGRKLFGTYVGLIASLLYGISVLPIQLSHFYAVDTLLTCFITATLYQLIKFYEKPSALSAATVGVLFGLALATKISAIVLVVSIGAALIADFLLLVLKNPSKHTKWYPHVPAFIKHLFVYAGIILTTTFCTFAFFEPYALIDFNNFWLQTQQQSAMTKDAFTFPYTLQYVGKIPYLYELNNIFFVGLGPLLALLSFAGIVLLALHAWRKDKREKWAQETILLAFFLAYFITVGHFAIGFMRYMLPIYPMLILGAALTISIIFVHFKIHGRLRLILTSYIVALLFIWPLSFMHIYTQENTRVSATKWIHQNIPAGKTIAIEHWDDALPLHGAEQYIMTTLPLYDPDSPEKWVQISNTLQQSDYIVLASNRLYTPLQKLTNCNALPIGRCYAQSAEYYRKLFAEELGYKKVAEFTNYPTIPFFDISLNDQGADESFTVYDHPKVTIFQKVSQPPMLSF